MVSSKPCKVEGCNKSAYAKDMCMTHYQRLRRNPNADLTKPIQTKDQLPICKIEGCDRPTIAFSLCWAHYKRLRKDPNADLTKPIRVHKSRA